MPTYATDSYSATSSPTGTAAATSAATTYATASSPTGGAASPAEEIASSRSTRVGGPTIGPTIRPLSFTASDRSRINPLVIRSTRRRGEAPWSREQLAAWESTGSRGTLPPKKRLPSGSADMPRLTSDVNLTAWISKSKLKPKLELVKLLQPKQDEAFALDAGIPKIPEKAGCGGPCGCADCAKKPSKALVVLAVVGIVVGGALVARGIFA